MLPATKSDCSYTDIRTKKYFDCYMGLFVLASSMHNFHSHLYSLKLILCKASGWKGTDEYNNDDVLLQTAEKIKAPKIKCNIEQNIDAFGGGGRSTVSIVL